MTAAQPGPGPSRSSSSCCAPWPRAARSPTEIHRRGGETRSRNSSSWSVFSPNPPSMRIELRTGHLARDVEFCLGAADDGAEQPRHPRRSVLDEPAQHLAGLTVELDFSVRLLVGFHLPQHAVFQDCGQRLERDRGVQMRRRDPASWLERFRTACSLRCAVTSGDAQVRPAIAPSR